MRSDLDMASQGTCRIGRVGTKPFASWTKKPLLLFRRSALLLFRLKHLQHRRPSQPPMLSSLGRLPQQRPPRHLLRTSPFYAKNQTARAANAGSESKMAQAAENDFPPRMKAVGNHGRRSVDDSRRGYGRRGCGMDQNSRLCFIMHAVSTMSPLRNES